jgi:hypothetical protein
VFSGVNITGIGGGGLISTNTAITPTGVVWPVGVADTNNLARRILSDANGAIHIAGANPYIFPQGNVASNVPAYRYPITIKDESGSQNENDGVVEALNKIVYEIQKLNIFIRELPTYLNQGINMSDDDDRFDGGSGAGEAFSNDRTGPGKY